MSWQASTWASWYSESRLSDRLVMFVIAHHVSDEEGEAHPSIKTICKETRLGRSTVVESIYSLARVGELTIVRGGKFRGDSNSYTLPKFNLWVQSLAPKESVKSPFRVRKGSRVGANRIVGELNTGKEPPHQPEVQCQFCNAWLPKAAMKRHNCQRKTA
jgi:hypothetical protein